MNIRVLVGQELVYLVIAPLQHLFSNVNEDTVEQKSSALTCIILYQTSLHSRGTRQTCNAILVAKLDNLATKQKRTDLRDSSHSKFQPYQFPRSFKTGPAGTSSSAWSRCASCASRGATSERRLLTCPRTRTFKGNNLHVLQAKCTNTKSCYEPKYD